MDLIGKVIENATKSECCMRFVESDKREVAVIARVEGLVVVHGKQNFVMFNLSPRAAVKILFFLFRWWALTCWCGLRNKILDFAIWRFTVRASKGFKPNGT